MTMEKTREISVPESVYAALTAFMEKASDELGFTITDAQAVAHLLKLQNVIPTVTLATPSGAFTLKRTTIDALQRDYSVAPGVSPSKINAIKTMRTISGLGLREAKDIVEKLIARGMLKDFSK